MNKYKNPRSYTNWQVLRLLSCINVFMYPTFMYSFLSIVVTNVLLLILYSYFTIIAISHRDVVTVGLVDIFKCYLLNVPESANNSTKSFSQGNSFNVKFKENISQDNCRIALKKHSRKITFFMRISFCVIFFAY